MNDYVEGVLFEISARDEASLDEKEGVSSGSYQKAELPVLHEGLAEVALVGQCHQVPEVAQVHAEMIAAAYRRVQSNQAG